MKSLRLPGLFAYAAVTLWFLLTVLAPSPARSQEAPISVFASDLIPTIEAALIKKGTPSTAGITLDNPHAKITLVDGEAPRFVSVSINPVSGRFIIRTASTETSHSLLISGRASVALDIPVLNRPVARGEIIEESDIFIVTRDDIRPGYFETDASALIGKQAKRALGPNTPLRSSDIAAPMLIKRGALVRLSFEARGLRLMDQGVALANGALDEVVKIENAKSERTLRAIVTGPNQARVIGSRNTAQANF